jgi:hypothetical protein
VTVSWTVDEYVTRYHKDKHIYVLGGRYDMWKATEPCLSCEMMGVRHDVTFLHD